MEPVAIRRKIASAILPLLLLVTLLMPCAGPAFALDDGITDYLTIPTGSYIINMGVMPQTVANGLKPYGLVYDLVKNQKVPVHWAINPNKAKDGIDFTDPNSGKSYIAGPFIVSADNLTPAAVTTITSWKAQGVVVDGPTTGPIYNVPVYDTVSGIAKVALDLASGSIVAGYLSAAGVPSTSYTYKTPVQLDPCDDFFALPHADPTWATHSNLINFTRDGGYLWSACHAVSVLENIDDPTTPTVNPDMNFLSQTGLVPFGSHSDGSPPYTSIMPGDPIMQFMGTTDAAQQGGSEQIYLPKLSGGWRPGAKVLVYDPTQANVPSLSPGPAAAIVAGRAYDIASYGKVMYEGGHNVGGTAAANIAAQRAFLNFWLLGLVEHAPDPIADISASIVYENESSTLTATVNSLSGVTYQWSSSGGGTFGTTTAPTTTFIPPEVSGTTTFYIKLTVTDSCGRPGYDVLPLTITNLPKADLAIAKTDSKDPVSASGSYSYNLAVSNLGTETATSVVVEDILPAELTYVSASGTGWTCGYDTGTRKVTCTRPSLALTGSTPSNITINVTAPPAPTTITNTATVSSALPDVNLANNSSTQNTVVLQGIDVELTKTAAPISPATLYYSGQPFRYTLLVRNISALPATNLTVTDILPASLTFVSASGTGWYCVYNSPDRVVTCHLNSLAALASSTITLTVTPSGSAGDSIVNTATVTSPDFVDQNPANNTSTASIALSAPADLEITKSGSTTGGGGTQKDTFTVTLTNKGPGTATGITVRDTMSGYTTGSLDKYASACTVTPSIGTFAYDAGTTWGDNTPNYGTWTITSLSNGSSATLTFVCTGDNNNGVTNQVTVTSASYDSNATNNTASAFVVDGTTKTLDMTISKTDSADPVYVGQNVTYTVTVTNLSATLDAKGSFTVTDTLPPGTTYVSYTAGTFGGSCSHSAGVVTCTTTSDINKTTSRSFTITVKAPATGGVIINTAQVRYTSANDEYDPVTNNTAIQQTTVIYYPTDILVTKTVDNATPVLGGNVKFTITAANIGPNAASNLRLTDLLPVGLTYRTSIPAVPSQGSYDPATGLWYVGSLAAGASATLQITTGATATVVSTNTACFYAMDQTDTNSVNNCASATVTPQYADLALTKTASTTTPNTNANVNFTVTLTNNGPSTVSMVTVEDLLPDGLEFVSATASVGSYDQATGKWILGASTLASGASATLTITARVTIPAAPLTNTATITASGLPDTNTSNNTASATVTGQQTDIEVAKSVDIPTPLALNTTLTFTVTVKNNGPSNATGIKVKDQLPAGLAYQSHIASQGTYDPATGVWDVGALVAAAGDPPAPVATLSLVATNTVYGFITNTASKTAVDQYDNDAQNDTASVTILSGGAADLEVTKIVDTPNTYQSDEVTFTVRLRNLGPNPADGVVVHDLLPTGLTYVSSSASQGSYDSATGDWTLGATALAPPQMISGQKEYYPVFLSITARVNTPGIFTNTAAVTALNQTDPDATNNTSSAAVDAEPAADLAITKSGPTSVSLASGVSYTLTARNNGPSDVTGAVIADTVPSQITAVSWSCTAVGDADCDTTTAGSSASGSSNTITLSHVRIAAGADKYLTIIVDGTAGTTGTFTNTAIFSPPPSNTVYDTNVMNNSASVSTTVSNVLLTGRVVADTGTGGGTANDGMLNGGETGIAKVTVALTNCGATTYATATTDGSGNYTLAIPNTVLPGTTLCVVETNLAGYLSTGGQVGNTGGSYDRTSDRVQFVLAANTNYANVNFGDVPENRFLTDGTRSALPGSTVSYPHTFIAGTGGQVTFSTMSAASPAITGWSEILYRDAACDGVLTTPTDQMISGPITVTEGERVCLIMQEFVPANAPPAASNLVTIQAFFNYSNANPAMVTTYMHQDLTTVSDVALSLTKEVRNITRNGPWAVSNTAKQGDELEYRITYLNAGTLPINNLLIHDASPAFTVYTSAQCGLPLPPSLTSCTVSVSPPVGSSGSIKWSFSGSLAGSAPGTVSYRVKVE